MSLRERLTFTLLGIITAEAQDTTKPWKIEGLLGLQAAQTALSNWRAGGQNQMSLGSQQHLALTREGPIHALLLDYSGQYGVLRVVPQRTWRKTQDFLLIVAQYKRILSPRWALSVISDGRTQWAPTYDYAGDSTVRPAKSAFLAPLYAQFSVGVTYKVLEDWKLTFSPLSGRVTYVRLSHLADAGAFGLKPAQRDPNGTILQPARKTLWEVGARLTSRLSLNPTLTFSISHFLDLFYSYDTRLRSPIALSQLQASYKFHTWLALSLSQQTIYDPRVGRGKDALQLLTAWTLGITWRIKYPKVPS
ncbi:MAG: DUF3078 domain-containing protein [Bacteroidia bacterium]|nr:DUF3078 domain-containing protein [Bacteroidia bacterium]MDW8235456.1 DUF3078 domain-containing protein [Bacteroidia bacterium]